MTYIAKPKVYHPSLQKNEIGLTRRDYEGAITTLCAGLRSRFDHRRGDPGVLGVVDCAASRGQALGDRLLVEDARVFPARGARLQQRARPHAGGGHRCQRRQRRSALHRRLGRRRFAVDRPRPDVPRDSPQRQPALHPREQRRLRAHQGTVLGVGRQGLARQEGRGEHDGSHRRRAAGADARRDVRRAQLLRRQGAAGADHQGRPRAPRLCVHRRHLAVRHVQRSRRIDQELRLYAREECRGRAGGFRSAGRGDHDGVRRRHGART